MTADGCSQAAPSKRCAFRNGLDATLARHHRGCVEFISKDAAGHLTVHHMHRDTSTLEQASVRNGSPAVGYLDAGAPLRVLRAVRTPAYPASGAPSGFRGHALDGCIWVVVVDGGANGLRD